MKQTKSLASENPLDLKWSQSLNITPVFALTALQDSLLVVGKGRNRQDSASHLFALQLDTGHPVWHYRASEGIISGLCIAGFSDVQDQLETAIIVTVQNKNLLAGGCQLIVLDKLGTVLLTHELRLIKQISAPLWVATEQSILVTTDRENVCQIDVQSGKIINKFTLSQSVSSASPATIDSQIIFPCLGSRLEAFDIHGKQLWQYNHEDPSVWLNQTPTILKDRVFVLTTDGELVSLQLQSGELLWKKAIPNLRGPFSAMSHNGQYLFVGGDAGLFAFQSEDGHLQWHFPTTRPVTAVPIIKKNQVYIAAHDHAIYVLDAATGQQLSLYNAALSRRIEHDPMLQARGDETNFYFVEQHGTVHCLNWKEIPALSQTNKQKIELLKTAHSFEDRGKLKDAAHLYNMCHAWEDAVRVWKLLDDKYEFANALFQLATERNGDPHLTDAERANSWEHAQIALTAIGSTHKAQFCRDQAALIRKHPVLQVEITIGNLIVEQWAELMPNIQNIGFGAAQDIRMQLKSPDFKTKNKKLNKKHLPIESHWQPTIRVKPRAVGEQFLKFELLFSVGKITYTEEISLPCQVLHYENSLEKKLIQVLRNQIKDVFALEELKTLCTDLGLNYDEFPKDSLTSFTRELIAFHVRNGILDELINMCEEKRSHKDWEQFRKIQS